MVHGRMSGDELEDEILKFREGKYDVLIATTVIENGVNFFNANTIVILDCDTFGLSQLHQLRGRVGRGDRQAYCHLMYRLDPIPHDARQRLVALVHHSYLGAGFEIAMRDLEIRGAGDILGVRQSGVSSETGIGLYLRLLEEAIEEQKNGNTQGGAAQWEPKIDIDISYALPEAAFGSTTDKLQFVRALEYTTSHEAIDEARSDLQDRLEEAVIPASSESFFVLLHAKVYTKDAHIARIWSMERQYVLDFRPGTSVDDVRKFLATHKHIDWKVVNSSRLSTPTANYAGAAVFLSEMMK
jgi:transcription-repair coupling factor (superfamily II helicase)